MINYDELDKLESLSHPANQNEQMDIEQIEEMPQTPHKKEKTGLMRFPMAKIKNIMKLDEENKLCQKNAYYIIGKMTELFLQELASTSHSVAKANRRKTLNLEDLVCAVKSIDKFNFIDINSILNIETVESIKKKEEKTKTSETKKEAKTAKNAKKSTSIPSQNVKIDQMFNKK